MIAKDTLEYVVRAKTGWSDEEKRIIGWYIGYIEKNNVYYFANCIQSPDLDNTELQEQELKLHIEYWTT